MSVPNTTHPLPSIPSRSEFIYLLINLSTITLRLDPHGVRDNTWSSTISGNSSPFAYLSYTNIEPIGHWTKSWGALTPKPVILYSHILLNSIAIFHIGWQIYCACCQKIWRNVSWENKKHYFFSFFLFFFLSFFLVLSFLSFFLSSFFLSSFFLSFLFSLFLSFFLSFFFLSFFKIILCHVENKGLEKNSLKHELEESMWSCSDFKRRNSVEKKQRCWWMSWTLKLAEFQTNFSTFQENKGLQ